MRLVQWIHRRQYTRRGNTLVISPTFSANEHLKETTLFSRDGCKVNARQVLTSKAVDIVTLAECVQAKFVGIDEAQFFNAVELYAVCQKLVMQKIDVFLCMLDLDYRQQMWETTQLILSMADTYKKVTACCQGCGADAPFTGRRVGFGEEQILVGNIADVGKNPQPYIPLCRACLHAKRSAGEIS